MAVSRKDAMYFLIWKNYDGEHLEDFTSRRKLNKRYGELIEQYKTNDYGTGIIAVIKGELLDMQKLEKQAGIKINKLVKLR